MDMLIFLPLLFVGFAMSSNDDEPDDQSLNGTEGNDLLQGGAGDDILFGYAGSTLTGGAGADVFWSGYDAGETAASTVTDFTPGEDSIEIVVYAAEVIPGYDIQPMGTTDTAIVVDGVTRLILAGITPAQIDPAAISIFHSP